MRTLVKKLESFLEGNKAYWRDRIKNDHTFREKNFVGGIGTFGGKQHNWPGKFGASNTGSPSKDWDLISSGDRDVAGNAWTVSYLYIGKEPLNVTVDFDAGPWLKTEGKKPVKYEIESYGKKKAGSIKDPGQVLKALHQAEAFAVSLRDGVISRMPKVGGWDLSETGHEVVYFFDDANKYGISLSVTIEDEPWSMSYAGGAGVARVDVSTDYEDVSKDFPFKKPSEIAKIHKSAHEIMMGTTAMRKVR